MTSNKELIAEAHAISNWQTHVEADTLFYRLADALEAADAKIEAARMEVGHYSTCRSTCDCSESILDALSDA